MEDLAHLIHAIEMGVHYEIFDRKDYAHAASCSKSFRAARPGDRSWMRAQIAARRAEGLDPITEFAASIESDPDLDQHAFLHGGWPKPYLSYGFNERPALNRGGILFFKLMYHHQTRYRSDVENGMYHKSVIFAIRGVISLLGQEGFDEILIHDSVQDVLRSTPLCEFGPGGEYPKLFLRSSPQ